MRHVPFALAWCVAATVVAQAAPPVVTVPQEVTGDVGSFVAVRATVTDAKIVKFVPVDAGLNVFPADLLADKTATVVTAGKNGRYRILCYSGNADGPSEPVVVTVVIGGGGPPVVDPVKPDPPKPDKPAPAEVFYFAVVGAAGPVLPAVATSLKLPAWDELRRAGHVVNYVPVNELSDGLPRPAMTPVVMVLKKDGDMWRDTGDNKPLPTTDEQIRGLLK
jgi:hypothetical protein